MAYRYKSPGADKGAPGASVGISFDHECSEITSPSLKIQESCRHLHSLGPRALSEFLQEFIGCCPGLELDARILFDRYERFSPEMMRTVGGDDWPAFRPYFLGGRDHD